MKHDCTLIIFAKAPVPGLAKTRLAPVLGAEGAALLASRMLATAIAHAIEANVGPVELCCTPDSSHPQFQQAASDHRIRLTVQGEGDLGERMHRAFARNLEMYRRAVLTGTDSPDLSPAELRSAAFALQSQPAVFAPAMDGGYVLVGLSRPMPLLFEGIAWSTSQVMAQTRQRLHQLGIAGHELPLRRDIDEPQDLAHVPKEWLQ